MLLEMLSVVMNSSSQQSQYLTFFLASLDTLEPPETSINWISSDSNCSDWYWMGQSH